MRQDYNKYLRSALTEENPFNSTQEIIHWLELQNSLVTVNIETISFSQLEKWDFKDHQKISHASNKFFSIEGIKVNIYGNTNVSWSQPIINQPEVGILGIITKEFDGVLYFLMQAKIEPGNVNYVQLSPTLQATKSNYTQVHNGTQPLYLEYFINLKNNLVLLDQLQSEQGARFIKKRNRNIIIQVFDELELFQEFKWLTLGQIVKLISYNNLVNMDTRTVISGIPFGSFESKIIDFYSGFFRKDKTHNIFHLELLRSTLNNEVSLYNIDEIISWFTALKSKYELNIKRIALHNLEEWVIEENQIRHVTNKYFKIIAVKVEIGNREIKKWTQPMVQPAQGGLCAFIASKINGIYHFLVQAKLECGNFDILEMAPTVQCLTGNYRDTEKGALPFLEYILNAKPEQIIFDSLLSEEGGRFYKEQNRNMIVLAEEDFEKDLPEHYIWMTINQLKTFLQFNNYLNIQARSLISAVNFM